MPAVMGRLDGIRSAGRLAASALASGLDSARARAAGLPTTARAVSPAWVSRALAPRYPGVRVAACELLDDDAGTTARARIAVRYADRGSGGPGGAAPPDSIFLKITPTAPLQRLFLAATGIGRNEVRFYHDVRPGLAVRAPAVHGIATAGPGRQFVLLLEDLAAAGADMAAVGDHLEVEGAARILDAMATLHASLWESPRFARDLAWVPDYERRAADMPWERFITGRMVGLTRRRYADELGAPLVEAAQTVVAHRDRLEWLWSRGPRTFVHGDAHLGNLFFESGATLTAGARGDGGPIAGFLDWQVCARAPGMRDVSYLLCTSLPSEAREANERELIAGYLAALRARGVDAPAFEAAWRQHRLYALYTFIAAAFTAAAGEGLQARAIAEAGLRRATRAVASLESVRCALHEGDGDA